MTYARALLPTGLVRSRKEDPYQGSIQDREEEGNKEKSEDVLRERKGKDSQYGKLILTKDASLGFFRWLGKKGNGSNDTEAAEV